LTTLSPTPIPPLAQATNISRRIETSLKYHVNNREIKERIKRIVFQ
jgi:hypothetical protein